MDYAEVPLASVKRQKCVTFARPLTMVVPMLVHRTGPIKMNSLPDY